MKITIIGSTGFIGKFLSGELSVDFDVLNISVRNENLSDLRKEKIDQIFSSDFIINCASSLNPKTKNDFYLNEKFLSYLLTLNNQYKKKIIHLSSINTLIQNRMDSYSISKKKCEDENQNKVNLFLIRLPFVYLTENNLIQPKGNISILFSYLRKMKLPIYPMIYPGHLYQPIEINHLKKLILKIIHGSETSKEINLVGNKKKNLWDMFEEIAKMEKKRTLKLDSRFIYKILPKTIKSFIKKQNNFIQQLASIDHSKF